MSEENEFKSNTDNEHFQNNANHCIWKILKNDPRAGANAASRVDLTFAATDPLSEIVWSPSKGLRIQCADSSFADQSSYLFRDVGPSCMVLSPPQSVTGGRLTADEPVGDVLVKPIAVICTNSDIAATYASTMNPTTDSGVNPECKVYEENDIGAGSSGNKEEMNTSERAPNLSNDQNENLANDWEKSTGGDQAKIGTDQISGTTGNKFSAISGHVDQRPFDALLLQSDEAKPTMERNPSPGRPSIGGVDIGTGKKAVVEDDLHATVEPIIPGANVTSSGKSPLEKSESSAENDIQPVNCNAACPATSGVIANEIKNKSHDKKMILLCDKILPVMHSPCNSRINMSRNKGKEKSLSDGDANVRLSKEENDSQSSVESCNSTEFFPKGKKRPNFQQQLILGSKRVKKKHVEETSGSKSYVKKDISFINWISNMVKGLSHSIQNGSNTLAVTLANRDYHDLRRPDEKLVTCKMSQDPGPKNTGFKSIFQSMYCSSLKNVGTRTFRQEGEGSEDLEPSNMVQGIDATPITCCAEKNSSSEACTRRYDAGPSSQPMIIHANIFNSQESSKNNPVEDENCSILGLIKEKETMASNSSSSRQNTNNTENIDSTAPSERKEADNICLGRDAPGNMWITRFSPKSTAPLVISDHLDERYESQVHINDCHKHISYMKKNCRIEETREQPANATEAFTGLHEDKDNNVHNNFNSLSSSPGFRNSVLMTSMFARRFGAIKHTTPTNKADCTSQVVLFCLFCGTRGHQLCDCSEIAEGELEDLQKNMNSYGELEGSPCICIKCFQTNHWAISCPTSISKRKHEWEVKPLVNDCILSGEHLIPSIEGSSRFLSGKAGLILSGGTINDGSDHQANQNINLKRKLNEKTTFKIGCSASFKKQCSSSSEENKFKGNPITSPSRLTGRQISHIPKGIFDAVKKLRLSRTDILRDRNT
ncbi:uncharacterized protein LOC130741356 isoform X3 [Lotus japonicus]|uniref:uncharacterized protein LOC130741356 isoform X3 n=1 Tax=Lotus japonicus TaxID=34305 RepID=UPI002587F15A|nr:uncharacterized protein LOC130741356 isoform X3 [Lotus japonicus]